MKTRTGRKMEPPWLTAGDVLPGLVVVAVVLGVAALIAWAIVTSVKYEHACNDHGGHTVTIQTGWHTTIHYTYDSKGNITGSYPTVDPDYTTYCRDSSGRDLTW